MPPIVKFLIIMILLVGSAVYFHFNRDQQTYSKTLFGFNNLAIELEYERRQS